MGGCGSEQLSELHSWRGLSLQWSVCVALAPVLSRIGHLFLVSEAFLLYPKCSCSVQSQPFFFGGGVGSFLSEEKFLSRAWASLTFLIFPQPYNMPGSDKAVGRNKAGFCASINKKASSINWSLRNLPQSHWLSQIHLVRFPFAEESLVRGILVTSGFLGSQDCRSPFSFLPLPQHSYWLCVCTESCHSWWSGTHLWCIVGAQSIAWRFLEILKIELLYNPAIPLPGMSPKELKAKIQTDICTPMFTAVLLIVAMRWKQSKFQWMNKMWLIHTMACDSALKKKS